MTFMLLGLALGVPAALAACVAEPVVWPEPPIRSRMSAIPNNEEAHQYYERHRAWKGKSSRSKNAPKITAPFNSRLIAIYPAPCTVT